MSDFEDTQTLFQILGTKGEMTAEHDQIWFYPDPPVRPGDLSEEDLKTIDAMYVSYDEEYDGWLMFV